MGDLNENDSFSLHFQRDMSDDMYSNLVNAKHSIVKEIWSTLGQLFIKLPMAVSFDNNNENYVQFGTPVKKIVNFDWNQFGIKSQISENIIDAFIKYTGKPSFSVLHSELLSIICDYKDFYFTERNMDNYKDLRFIYCLHAINHALKTRIKIVHHNARLTDKTDIPDEFRDQGLVRPKVLILVPFRSSAFEIVKILSAILLPNEKDNVINKKRFTDEFSGEDVSLSQKKSKPDDFKDTFSGNVDDNFKIGIAVTKKSLKLYSDFYASDIIIASPLGLRLIIGAEGEADRDYDFLASIEVLIVDQAEIFLMQNWDHVLHVIDHMHLQPKESHGINFARVRLWSINNWTRYYCQTLVFTSLALPQITALVSSRCKNYAGLVRTNNPIKNGTISQVIVRIPQVFYKIKEASATETLDARFELFVNKILPQYQDNSLGHVLIYIPSYFDFVRLRNHFITEMISFAQICEYTKERKVAEARDKFFHQEVNFLLYSERFHFYNRRKIRGIQHIIFYQIPTFPHFYSEMCNLMQDANQNRKQRQDSFNMTIVAIYSKYDVTQLSGIVTTSRASRMFNPDKDVYMFSTDDL